MDLFRARVVKESKVSIMKGFSSKTTFKKHKLNCRIRNIENLQIIHELLLHPLTVLCT